MKLAVMPRCSPVVERLTEAEPLKAVHRQAGSPTGKSEGKSRTSS